MAIWRSDVRELGGDGFELWMLALEVDALCRSNWGGGESGVYCVSALTFGTDIDAVAAVIVGRRPPEPRRANDASNSTTLRDGELREEGDRDLSGTSRLV